MERWFLQSPQYSATTRSSRRRYRQLLAPIRPKTFSSSKPKITHQTPTLCRRLHESTPETIPQSTTCKRQSSDFSNTKSPPESQRLTAVSKLFCPRLCHKNGEAAFDFQHGQIFNDVWIKAKACYTPRSPSSRISIIIAFSSTAGQNNATAPSCRSIHLRPAKQESRCSFPGYQNISADDKRQSCQRINPPP